MAVLAQSAEICYTEPERKCFPVRCDCHIHMVLDGADWKRAIARHSGGVDEVWVRRVLETYQKLGFAYLRDGGDRWSVGAKARSLAGEYGITYRTPLSPLCAQGHYGGFIGEKYENLSQYATMVTQKRADGADFIKIMISGLMDFDRFGVLTEDGLPPETIRELIHIAHEEGFAVMAHANGARTVEAAALAGVVVLGRSFAAVGTAEMATSRLSWTALVLVGYALLIFSAMRLLLEALSASGEKGDGRFPLPGPAPVWLGALLLACWLPWFVCLFPGTVSNDSISQLKELMGLTPMTNANPVFQTWLLGAFRQVGLWLGSADAGVALYCVTQAALMAWLLGARKILVWKNAELTLDWKRPDLP